MSNAFYSSISEHVKNFLESSLLYYKVTVISVKNMDIKILTIGNELKKYVN